MYVGLLALAGYMYLGLLALAGYMYVGLLALAGYMYNNNNNNNNWDDLYSAVRMGITKNKGAVTYKLMVIRLSKQKGLEVCFKAVYCR